ncbi:MAG: metal-dependent hydrolase [Flavobacteriales bacterium]|nr:metal-dependent hydrolase [Flavobacteriales bacterium]MAZ97792.1 metal-dependent hydrolase [Flavobacteriales bacterium]|tara:strand:- start:675 stop:1202 length:528 start_codon:yes stop_codon:yes gene_type:complete
MDVEFLKYPIGKASIESDPPIERVEGCIAVIGRMPKQLMEFAKALTDEQWDTSYRQEGWTIRQVVHHLADSHMNGFNRQRLAVTSLETPKVTGYPQTLFAALPDYTSDPFLSVILLASLHEKWVSFLNGITETGWKKSYFHLDESKEYTMKESVQMYAWHCQHHMAHIRLVIDKQ